MVFLLAKTHQEFDLTWAWNWEVRKKTEKTSLSRCNGCLQSLVTSQSVWFRLHIPTKMTLAERKNFINSAQRWFIYSVEGKVQMGYKMCTPGVQIFVGYKRSKWGTVGNSADTMMVSFEWHKMNLKLIFFVIVIFLMTSIDKESYCILYFLYIS
jgi:hypothetical protein